MLYVNGVIQFCQDLAQSQAIRGRRPAGPPIAGSAPAVESSFFLHELPPPVRVKTGETRTVNCYC